VEAADRIVEFKRVDGLNFNSPDSPFLHSCQVPARVPALSPQARTTTSASGCGCRQEGSRSFDANVSHSAAGPVCLAACTKRTPTIGSRADNLRSVFNRLPYQMHFEAKL